MFLIKLCLYMVNIITDLVASKLAKFIIFSLNLFGFLPDMIDSLVYLESEHHSTYQICLLLINIAYVHLLILSYKTVVYCFKIDISLYPRLKLALFAFLFANIISFSLIINDSLLLIYLIMILYLVILNVFFSIIYIIINFIINFMK